jgi:hypothetical protein
LVFIQQAPLKKTKLPPPGCGSPRNNSRIQISKLFKALITIGPLETGAGRPALVIRQCLVLK